MSVYVGKQMLMPQRGGKILVRAVNIKLILFLYGYIYIYIFSPSYLSAVIFPLLFSICLLSLSLSLSHSSLLLQQVIQATALGAISHLSLTILLHSPPTRRVASSHTY